MLKTTPPLEGVIPALITPFAASGNIDFVLLEKQVSYLASAGVHGFFVNGSTGEGPYLTTAEKIEVFKTVKTVAQGRQMLCLACIQASTEMVIREMQAFESLEPDFMVAATPYYYTASQAAIVRHYQEIARHAPAPLILYTIPACTHNPITLETILELASVEQIVGVKDSSGDFSAFQRGVYTEFARDFAWIQGEDALDGPSLLIGAQGIVTGLGNVWIDPYLEVYRAAKQGDLAGVRAAQKRINALYRILTLSDHQIIPGIKAAVTLLGRSTPWMKLPGLTLSEEHHVQIEDVLQTLKVL